jgi:hypothetical protein
MYNWKRRLSYLVTYPSFWKKRKSIDMSLHRFLISTWSYPLTLILFFSDDFNQTYVNYEWVNWLWPILRRRNKSVDTISMYLFDYSIKCIDVNQTWLSSSFLVQIIWIDPESTMDESDDPDLLYNKESNLSTPSVCIYLTSIECIDVTLKLSLSSFLFQIIWIDPDSVTEESGIPDLFDGDESNLSTPSVCIHWWALNALTSV